MGKILIKNLEIGNSKKNLFIENGLIKQISSKVLKTCGSCKVIEANSLFPVLGFFNMHTHAAMSIFRGINDDLPVGDWLKKVIWPNEIKLTKNKVQCGSEVAIKEMLKTGTIGFNDMYFFPDITASILSKYRMPAIIGLGLFSIKGAPKFFTRKYIEKNYQKLLKVKAQNKNIEIAICPHAPFSVCEEDWIWARDFAKKNNLFIHTHLKETKNEKGDHAKYGLTSVEYLDRLRVLGPKTILAHCVHLNDSEINLIAKSGAMTVYCPSSNMKLASGEGEAFPFRKLKKSGARVGLGTDGPASNNGLNMIQEMKTGALLQKHNSKNAAEISAVEIYETATVDAYRFLGFDYELEVGKQANLLLVDKTKEEFFGRGDKISNLVYASNIDCIKYSIFKGNILYAT